MDLNVITGSLSGWIWNIAMLVLCIAIGLFYTVRLRAPQVRLVRDMGYYLFKGKSSETGTSSFQSFAIALSGRVGTGAIAGVATAICFGGPGAVFWMWVIGILGAATAFAEATLGQIWKEEIKGEYRGGPAYYIEKGLGSKFKWLAVIFAVCAVIANGFTGPTVQSHTIAEGIHNAFGISPLVTGIGLAVIFALIVFGGIKRIAKFAQLIVPFMAIGYIIVSLIILVANASAIPSMFGLIFKSAFGTEALFGGIIGSTILWGIKRGVYASEAGMGTGAQAAASAEVSHPVKQGLAQSFSVYVDILFVCTATALMILATGMYNVQDGAGAFLTEGLQGIEPGPGYTQEAVNTVFPGFGAGFVAVALLFFAFTTIVSFAFYTDNNIAYLFKKNRNYKWIQNALKCLIIVMIIFGAVRSAEVAWNMADIGVGLTVWVNLIALILLTKPVHLALKDYERQKKLGLDPVFDPNEAGIKNADLWFDIVKNKFGNLNKGKAEKV
ncbi:MAG: alanine:cation symporter family protein [Clostridiales Family XIII bacterium]|jgi:AGCS family alanine or glycine:cation symporter|nr:alanine:cation symporter family protein [Clostridiales Family XIII bacterium]